MPAVLLTSRNSLHLWRFRGAEHRLDLPERERQMHVVVPDPQLLGHALPPRAADSLQPARLRADEKSGTYHAATSHRHLCFRSLPPHLCQILGISSGLLPPKCFDRRCESACSFLARPFAEVLRKGCGGGCRRHSYVDVISSLDDVGTTIFTYVRSVLISERGAGAAASRPCWRASVVRSSFCKERTPGRVYIPCHS